MSYSPTIQAKYGKNSKNVCTNKTAKKIYRFVYIEMKGLESRDYKRITRKTLLNSINKSLEIKRGHKYFKKTKEMQM